MFIPSYYDCIETTFASRQYVTNLIALFYYGERGGDCVTLLVSNTFS